MQFVTKFVCKFCHAEVCLQSVQRLSAALQSLSCRGCAEAAQGLCRGCTEAMQRLYSGCTEAAQWLNSGCAEAAQMLCRGFLLKKSIALDRTGYGAVQRVHLGPLNRTFPAPYFPGSPLSVENHCFGTSGQSASLRRRYPSKKKCQTSTSDGDGQGGCPRGPGNRGGHGLSRVGDGSPCAARNPLVMPKNAPLRRLRTEGPHAEISDFSPGSFPKLSTPIDLPGGHWA